MRGPRARARRPTPAPPRPRAGRGRHRSRPGLGQDPGGAFHPQWGLLPGPGTAQVYVYPGARGGRLIADVVRHGKGHTEGLEPHITEKLITMMVAAPGGKLRSAPAVGYA